MKQEPIEKRELAELTVGGFIGFLCGLLTTLACAIGVGIGYLIWG